MNPGPEPKNAGVVNARAAHTHHWGVMTFTKKPTNAHATDEQTEMSSGCWPRKVAKTPAHKYMSPIPSTMHTPPTKREIDDAKKRIVTLHKALLDKSLVNTPDMDVEEMLSIMSRVVDEQRVLSIMYDDLVHHNIAERIATGNNDKRRPAVGAGPALPVYSTHASTVMERTYQMKADRQRTMMPYNDEMAPEAPENQRIYSTHTSTVRERVKEMQQQRHYTLLPYPDLIAPGTKTNSLLSPEDKNFVAAHTNLKHHTVKTEDVIKKAAAVKAISQKFEPIKEAVKTTAAGAKAINDIKKLEEKTKVELKEQVPILVAKSKAVAKIAAPLLATGGGSALAIPDPSKVIVDPAKAAANAEAAAKAAKTKKTADDAAAAAKAAAETKAKADKAAAATKKAADDAAALKKATTTATTPAAPKIALATPLQKNPVATPKPAAVPAKK
jgi:hypothetical protein